MWSLLLGSLFLTAFLTGFRHRGGKPRVQLGDTTLIGKRLRPSNLDFFGGLCLLCLLYGAISSSGLIPRFSGIPFAEPPIDGLRFAPPQPKHSLSPLRSFDARNYGLPCLQPVIIYPRSSV